MRAARAVRAAVRPDAIDPDAVREGPPVPGRGRGRSSTAARPSTRNTVDRRGNVRSRPRASRTTATPASTRTTVPAKPDSGCATARPGSAGTVAGRAGTRGRPARTSGG